MRNKTSRSKAAKWGIAAILVVFITWWFPLFHIVSLKAVLAHAQQSQFDPRQFAADFWDNQLLPAKAKAADADTVLTAWKLDSAACGSKFGRTVEVGGPTEFFITGSGTISQIDPDGITLHLSGGHQLIIDTGIVFGNAVRDGTGLLNSNQFTNSKQFNDLSQELNTLVETRVLSKLQSVKTGQVIQFTGVAEASPDLSNSDILHLVPVAAEIH